MPHFGDEPYKIGFVAQETQGGENLLLCREGDFPASPVYTQNALQKRFDLMSGWPT